MTKQDFIKKWIGWVSYTDREKLTNEMESDLDAVNQALRIHDVVGRSEQLVCDCGDSSMTWYGNDDDKKWFCFNCKKEAN